MTVTTTTLVEVRYFTATRTWWVERNDNPTGREMETFHRSVGAVSYLVDEHGLTRSHAHFVVCESILRTPLPVRIEV